ncbi:MAG: hypothetical protein RL385_2433 [Pseudomonadota bacterium]
MSSALCMQPRVALKLARVRACEAYCLAGFPVVVAIIGAQCRPPAEEGEEGARAGGKGHNRPWIRLTVRRARGLSGPSGADSHGALAAAAKLALGVQAKLCAPQVHAHAAPRLPCY